MKHIIEYESDTILPKEMIEKFHKAINDIVDIRHEPDKIDCVVHRLKGDMIRWLADNKQRIIKWKR
jgi:hypothetical protein